MVLATIIRLEMAYPGVGVLAGDSLQYLSVVTAHAVIMVFFMIMPLIFGAFGNFLLPTQLGVHDVAFPRLNSAAFWFLPAGLIMLCQLVCLDRRYQRMNCFNIREVESLLKSRFFPDLINSHDYRILLVNTTLGLRFKLHNLGTIDNAFLLFNQYGLEQPVKLKTLTYKFFNDRPRTGEPILDQLSSCEISYERVELLFTQIKKLPVGFLFDAQLLFSITFLDEFENKGILRMGAYNTFEFIGFLGIYLKTELERQFFTVLYLFNTLKTSPENLYGPVNFRLKFLDQFLFGYMENNMGIYRLMTRFWPEPRDPKIITSGGFIEFYVTATDQLLSRSIFLYCEVIRQEFVDFCTRMLVGLALDFFNCISYLFSINELDFSAKFLDSKAGFFFPSIPSTFLNGLYVLPYLRINFFLLEFFFQEISNLVLPTYHLYAFFSTKNLYNRTISNNLTSKSLINDGLKHSSLHQFNEISAKPRAIRAINPVFRYDYKVGNYLTKDDATTMAFLFTTINEITGGIRKSAWFFSKSFLELFNENFQKYLFLVQKPTLGVGSKHSATIQPTYSTFTIFSNITDSASFINTRHQSLASLDQKFAKMFLTSSLQQRIFANWRQLKFSREAWRCKLLASRHQKTLYKRYSDEDGIF